LFAELQLFFYEKFFKNSIAFARESSYIR